ncbi:MAG: winged helix-turn-helix domain-containing protein, partial [Clostridia bacterium]|nr:winged helix-turn-helix domain-containing protein [Clostridia bacterium]
FLATHPYQVFSREQLTSRLWHSELSGDTNTITVLVRRLREKVEANPARPRYIRTIWGIGYKFVPPASYSA